MVNRRPEGLSTNRHMLSEDANELRNCFRMLWEQHVYWARIVIQGIILDLPGLEAATERLLSNAPDFGRVFCRFYGKIIAAEITSLLREHFVTGAELVRESKVGNLRKIQDANRSWYENADAIACFLSHVNPYWSYDHMKAMWYMHLDLTKEDAGAILVNDYTKSVMVFNQVEKEALRMADEFANGILCQLCSG